MRAPSRNSSAVSSSARAVVRSTTLLMPSPRSSTSSCRAGVNSSGVNPEAWSAGQKRFPGRAKCCPTAPDHSPGLMPQNRTLRSGAITSGMTTSRAASSSAAVGRGLAFAAGRGFGVTRRSPRNTPRSFVLTRYVKYSLLDVAARRFRRAPLRRTARRRPARSRRGGLGLPPRLVRRAPQHAGHRLGRDQRRDRARRGEHRADPPRRGRRHAAEPRAARDRRTVRHPRSPAPRPHRPGPRPRPRLRPGHHARATPHPVLGRHVPQDVLELQGYLTGDTRIPGVHATPGDGSNVPLYILGSSLFGAQLAAALSLPYAFASHFAPAALFAAIQTYRAEYRPSETNPKPYLIVAANLIATDDEAEAQNQLQASLRWRARRFLKPAGDLADAEIDRILGTPSGEHIKDMMRYTAVGTREQAQAYLERLAEKTGADELMLAPASRTGTSGPRRRADQGPSHRRRHRLTQRTEYAACIGLSKLWCDPPRSPRKSCRVESCVSPALVVHDGKLILPFHAGTRTPRIR